VSSAALERVANVLRSETGIVIHGPQLASLEAALARLHPPLDAGAFLRSGAGDTPAELLERLIDEVTINETFFFRQREELDALDWRALLDAAQEAGSATIRVWVAACSTGEEAYTLGMLASEAFGTPEAPVSILATDISTVALERARQGRYRGRTVRTLDDGMRERYFVPDADGVAVGEPLRRMVEFRRHNLVNDPVPGPTQRRFDLIACRNVLIYFDAETVERAIATLEQALAPRGMLVLGAADRLCDSASRLGRPDSPRRVRAAPQIRELRRPLGRDEPQFAPASEPALATALEAANEGSLRDAVDITERMLETNPLDADAYFVRGLAELGLEDTDAAVASLRRALYVDPSFGLAAFKLARAHELRGDRDAAARAYEQALHTLDPEDSRHDAILDQVDVADVAVACGLSLTRLREELR
jgi:chemotaxis protein methyltransferase CheR